jgi:hypothetical protein
MALQRITALPGPPVVGQYYLVPTVNYPWLGNLPEVWPVFLPRHEDKEHLNFAEQHYHVDPRFLTKRLWDRTVTAGKPYDTGRDDDWGFAHCQRSPLSRWERSRAHGATLPHPAVAWRRLRCARVQIPYQFGFMPAIRGLREHFAGEQCRKARTGWVCPHKHVPLGQFPPDANGVITCPLHGLRVRASDGVCLG